MFQKGSRYEKCRKFAPATAGAPVFAGIRPRDIGPAAGVVEHVVRAGDRLDLLAHHYYNDDRLWWRIADANPGFTYAGDMTLQDMEGSVILIPKAKE